jgi:hypothetical protein
LKSENFWSKVNKTQSCWLWTGARTGNGYGVFRVDHKMMMAHRVAYLLCKGQLPTLELDHLCRIRLCVNPEHLEPVTHIENVSRSPIHDKNKTHCKQGHPFSELNTRLYRGKRFCRTCKKISDHEQYLRSVSPLSML